MLRVALFLLAAANLAAAGSEELRELIQNKIKLTGDLAQFFENAMDQQEVDCSQGQDLYCPLKTIPDVTFPVAGGAMTTSGDACCPKQYLQCQIRQNQQYCRTLGYYTIQASTANSESKCPPTTPDCTCQQSLSGESSLLLNFCPSTKPCCPDCSCYGDPHCRSFGQTSQIWAVCDSRDATCVHNFQTCAGVTYQGQACKWVPAHNGQIGYCAKADGTGTPSMLMYKKSYKKYFTPADQNTYQFTLTLTLGTYGSITGIDLLDTGTSAQTFSWFVDGTGACKANSAYPFNAKGQAYVSDLQSMVTMTLQCNTGGGRSPTSGRIDVLGLEDPWYIKTDNTFGGYCATGVIAEAAGEPSGSLCNTVDRQLATYFGCSPRTNINTCKSSWCSNNYYKLDYSQIVSPGTPVNTVAQKRKACSAFVNDASPAKVKNFLAASCATSQAVANGVYPQDPVACPDSEPCKSCMDNVLDFPDEIALILGGPPVTSPPTKVCPNLLAIGLARKQLGVSQSGIEIDFLNTNTNAWEPVFAIFNQEINQCDCQTIFVNGTTITNRPLVNPGKYRIKQCNGLDTDPSQDMCTSSPAYNATVAYSNPLSGNVFSQPLGLMFSEQRVVCNTETYYRGCPRGYQCCQWQDSYAWQSCMIGAYGNNYASLYPFCKFT